MKKKIMFISFFIIFVSLFSIGITVAYLTDEDNISNVYTIGKVSISLNEIDVDEFGVPIEGANRVHDNHYHLLPGYSYIKDPTVTINAGSSDSYIRLLVTINKINELNKIFDDNFLPETLVKGWDNEKWLYSGVLSNDDNSNTYEFRYYKVENGFDEDNEKSKKLEPLFNSFTVPGELTGTQLETLQELKITIIGQAIQTAGFNDADEAWDAFKIQYNK